MISFKNLNNFNKNLSNFSKKFYFIRKIFRKLFITKFITKLIKNTKVKTKNYYLLFNIKLNILYNTFLLNIYYINFVQKYYSK